MAVKSKILNCISEADKEYLVLECITPDQLAKCIRNDLLNIFTFSAFEYNLLFEGDLNRIMEYLHIFGNYLQGIGEILLNCNQNGQAIRMELKTNSTIIESVLNFMRNLSTIGNCSNVSMLSKRRTVKLDKTVYIHFEPSVFLRNMKTVHADLKPSKTLYDPCILSNFIQFAVLKSVSL